MNHNVDAFGFFNFWLTPAILIVCVLRFVRMHRNDVHVFVDDFLTHSRSFREYGNTYFTRDTVPPL